MSDQTPSSRPDDGRDLGDTGPIHDGNAHGPAFPSSPPPSGPPAGYTQPLPVGAWGPGSGTSPYAAPPAHQVKPAARGRRGFAAGVLAAALVVGVGGGVGGAAVGQRRSGSEAAPRCGCPSTATPSTSSNS